MGFWNCFFIYFILFEQAADKLFLEDLVPLKRAPKIQPKTEGWLLHTFSSNANRHHSHFYWSLAGVAGDV